MAALAGPTARPGSVRRHVAERPSISARPACHATTGQPARKPALDQVLATAVTSPDRAASRVRAAYDVGPASQPPTARIEQPGRRDRDGGRQRTQRPPAPVTTGAVAPRPVAADAGRPRAGQPDDATTATRTGEQVTGGEPEQRARRRTRRRRRGGPRVPQGRSCSAAAADDVRRSRTPHDQQHRALERDPRQRDAPSGKRARRRSRPAASVGEAPGRRCRRGRNPGQRPVASERRSAEGARPRRVAFIAPRVSRTPRRSSRRERVYRNPRARRSDRVPARPPHRAP